MDGWINLQTVDASGKHSGKSFTSCPLVVGFLLIITPYKITGTSSVAKTEDKLKLYKFIYWWHFRLQKNSRGAGKKRFQLHAPAAPRSQMHIWDARFMCDVGTFATKYCCLLGMLKKDLKDDDRMKTGRVWTCSVFHIK